MPQTTPKRLNLESVYWIVNDVTGIPFEHLTLSTRIDGMHLVRLETQLDVQLGAVVTLRQPTMTLGEIMQALGLLKS